jgi:Bacterial PH domain
VTSESITGAGTVGGVAGSDHPATDDRALVVVRPRKMLIAAWAGALVTLGLFVGIAVVLRATPTGVFFRFADQVALVLLGLFIAGGLLLFARPRVRADAEGIEVRNIFVTRRLPWALVLRVAFPDGASWARLDLPDDEYLPMLAIQAVDGQRAVDAITRVRALHARSRSS